MRRGFLVLDVGAVAGGLDRPRDLLEGMLYVEINRVVLLHPLRVVQYNEGHTAIARFAYQTSALATDRFRRVYYRCYAGFRVGGGDCAGAIADADHAAGRHQNRHRDDRSLSLALKGEPRCALVLAHVIDRAEPDPRRADQLSGSWSSST